MNDEQILRIIKMGMKFPANKIWTIYVAILAINFNLTFSNSQSSTIQPDFLEEPELIRRGDVLRKNMQKYLRNLEDFHLKLQGKWIPPKPLAIPQKPFKYLNPFRACRKLIDVDAYLRGEFRDSEIFFSNNDKQKKSDLSTSCLTEGGIPIVTCNEVHFDTGPVFLCFCSPDESNNSPFAYSYNGTQCLGEIGAVCDGVRVDCAPGLFCEEGICGGRNGIIERAYVGQLISYTEEDLENLVNKTIGDRDGVKQNLYLTSQIPPIKFSCNPRMYWQVLGNTIDLLTSVNTSRFDLQVSDPGYQGSMSMSLAMLDILIQESEFLKTGDVSLEGEDYDQLEHCFEQFPFMSCIAESEGLAKGNCRCSNFSKYFRYTEFEGRCIATVGSVCTSVRGSANFLCESGYSCESIGWPSQIEKQIPSVLTYLELKVCGGLKALLGEDISQEGHLHLHESRASEYDSSDRISAGKMFALSWFLHAMVLGINFIEHHLIKWQ